jgi:prophage DNA circulation protein
MAVVDFILEGSFKGIPFLFRQTSKTIGRKTIVYEYPNSDKRSTQDLGEKKAIYTITAYLTGSGADYFDRKKRFEQALSSAGKGTFVHPTDGTLTAQIDACVVSESTQEVGRVSYSITLIATTDPTFPTLSDSARPNIEAAFNDALNAVSIAFNETYFVTTSFQNAVLKYKNYYDQVLNQFNNIPEQIALNKDTISNFLNRLQSMQDSATAQVQSADGISSNVSALYSDMMQLNSTTSARSIMNQYFFGFTINADEHNDTQDEVEAAKNKIVIQTLINCYAILYEFQNTAQTSFLTEDSIKQRSDILSAQYDFVLNNRFYQEIDNTSTAVFDETVIDKITFLRDRTAQYLTQQLTNARRVSTIFAQNLSLVDLVIKLYGDIQLYDTIAALNSFANQAVISGYVKVLS